MRSYTIENKPYIENQIVPAMPYMGNKRKLATKILNAIYDTVGDFEKLYDLFGGGGSVSVAGLLAGHRVIYDEYNSGISNLMQYIKDGGELPNKWITREEFKKHKDGDDWYSGFIKCVWSFGNSQKAYLFGKEIEEYKRLGHLISVNHDEEARIELSKKLGVEIPQCKDRHEFRQFICKELKSRKGELEQLERLEQLEQLERLERLERLEISNKSYNEIEINDGVIYCDPPYKGTAKYKTEEFPYDEYYDWCRKMAKNNIVLCSEYWMPDDFECIWSKETKANFDCNRDSNDDKNKRIEKLFIIK